MHALKTAVSLALVMSAACSDDPRYLQPAEALEVGVPDSDITEASTQITLPVRLETDAEATARAARAAELATELSYIDLDDLRLSVEWSIRNLSDSDGTARIHLNGANERFAYAPAAFVVDPDDPDEERPPPLLGDIPLAIPATSTVNGVFREDQLREMAIDLELVTRGGLNPFAAILVRHEDIEEIVVDGADPIPYEGFGGLIRLDLTLLANRHMVLEYAVRVRSTRSPALVHDEGLAAEVGELTAFAPVDFVPPPPDP